MEFVVMNAIRRVDPLVPNPKTLKEPIHPYVIEGEKVHVNSIIEQESKGSAFLEGYYGSYFPSGPLFLSKAILNRGQAVKAEKILKHGHLFYGQRFKTTHRPLRGVFTHLSLMDYEGEDIRQEHYSIESLNHGNTEDVSYCHLFLHTEPLYYNNLSKRLVEISMTDLRTVAKEASFEALAAYCHWFSLDVEKVVSTFIYSDTEEYELEKRIKDFCHEARSKILNAVKRDIRMTVLKIGALESDKGKEGSRDVFNLEMELIKYREELQKLLEVQYVALNSLQLAIEKISLFHQELKEIYFTVILLKMVLQEWILDEKNPFLGWGQKFLLCRLLDEQLGVSTFVNSRGGGRAKFAFAVGYALNALRHLYGKSEVIEMALTWDEASRKLNRHHIENGARQPSDKKIQAVYNLRSFIYDTLCVFPKSQSIRGPSGTLINQEILSFLPAYIKSDDGDEIALVEYDRQSAEPAALTEKGRHWIEPLLPMTKV